MHVYENNHPSHHNIMKIICNRMSGFIYPFDINFHLICLYKLNSIHFLLLKLFDKNIHSIIKQQSTYYTSHHNFLKSFVSNVGIYLSIRYNLYI